MCYSLSISPPTLHPGGRVRIALCRNGPPTPSFRWDLHHEGQPTCRVTFPCQPIALPLDTPGLHRFTARRRRQPAPLARGACLVLDDLSLGLDRLLRRPGGAGLNELQAHCVTCGVPSEQVPRRLDACLSDFLRVAEAERRPDLLGLLLQLSRPRLLTALTRLGYDRDGAVTPEDVMQAAVCRAVERIDGFLLDETHRRFGPWITTIATNLGIDWFRHGERERQHRRSPDAEPAIDPGQQHREEDLRCLGIALIARATGALDETERRLLSERLLKGRTLKTIADGRGISVSTAHRQCKGVLEKLRREYERLLIEDIGEGG